MNRFFTLTLSSLIFPIVAFVSSQASAGQVVIDCTYSDQMYQAQFSATASLTVNSDNSVSGQVIYSTYNVVQGGLTSQSPVQVTGKLTVFPAGEMYVNETDSYQLTNGAEPRITFALNTGNKDLTSSRMLVNREMDYTANCNYR